MIIKYPTGFYYDILPIEPQDSGNITFTISNNTPPRTNLVFPKISAGVVERGQGRKPSVSYLDNRKYLGDLIFSISSSRRRVTGNNSRQFEIGQVLEFSNDDTVAIDPMLVNPVTEIQHNTNVFDYDKLGVTEEEQALIAQESLRAHSELTNQLNGLKQYRADAEAEINNQQKVVNEANRAITAMEAIKSADMLPLITKLTAKRDEAAAARDETIDLANDYAAQADDVLAQLRAVAVVLK